MNASTPPIHVGDIGLLAVVRALATVWEQPFVTQDVTAVRHALRERIRAVRPQGDVVDDFLVAVHELVINAAGHGGGSGVLRLREGDGMLAAEVSDHGPGFGGQTPQTEALPAGDVCGGRGLVLARMLTDGLVLVEGPHGVDAMVMVRVAQP